jgi:hypothetical protein
MPDSVAAAMLLKAVLPHVNVLAGGRAVHATRRLRCAPLPARSQSCPITRYHLFASLKRATTDAGILPLSGTGTSLA